MPTDASMSIKTSTTTAGPSAFLALNAHNDDFNSVLNRKREEPSIKYQFSADSSKSSDKK